MQEQTGVNIIINGNEPLLNSSHAQLEDNPIKSITSEDEEIKQKKKLEREKLIRIILILIWSLVINVGLPIAILQLTSHFTSLSDVYCVILSTIPPLLQSLYQLFIYFYTREIAAFDFVATLAIGASLINLLLLFLNISAQWMLLKDSIFTAIVGLAYYMSVLLAVYLPEMGIKGLVFYFARQFVTNYGKDKVKLVEFNEYWNKYPGFRYSVNYATVVWATVFQIELIIKTFIILYSGLSIDMLGTITTIMTYTVIALTMKWQMYYSKKRREQALKASLLQTSENQLQDNIPHTDQH
jgi:hypothetical protein